MAWATVLATLLSYGGLLTAAGGSAFVLRGADLVPSSALLVSLGAFALLFFTLSALLGVLPPRERPDPEDERERAIDWAGEKAASQTLVFAVVLVLFVPVLHTGLTRVADVLIAALILAQLAKEVRVVWACRRDAA